MIRLQEDDDTEGLFGDLRLRVIETVRAGASRCEAAEVFPLRSAPRSSVAPSARSALPSATTPAGRSSALRQQRGPTPDLLLRRPIVERHRALAEVPDFEHDGR